MPCKKPLISIFIVSVSAFVLATISTASASGNSFAAQSADKGFMVAEAHQHGGHTDNKDQHDQQRYCQNSMSQGGGSMMGHMKGRMRRGGHSYAYMITTHADELELSDAQLGRIFRLNLKHSQEHKQYRKRIRKSMMHFHHESMKPSTDDATLRKLGNNHMEAFKAMLEQHIRNRNVVHAILTTEQRDQLKTIKMDHGMHSGGRRKHGGNHSQHSY
jgi:hypothetical protein